MKNTFSKEFLLNNHGCYDDKTIPSLLEARGKEVDVTLEEIMSSNIPTEDKYWFLSNVVLSLEERKELFLLLMEEVSNNTEDITIKEFIASLILYAEQKINRDTLCNSYKKTSRVGWVVGHYGSYYSGSSLGFGLYKIYWLLSYLNRDSETRDLTWGIVNAYTR